MGIFYWKIFLISLGFASPFLNFEDTVELDWSTDFRQYPVSLRMFLRTIIIKSRRIISNEVYQIFRESIFIILFTYVPGFWIYIEKD